MIILISQYLYQIQDKLISNNIIIGNRQRFNSIFPQHPTANTAQRLPTGQIVHIQHGAPSPTPTAVRQAMPSPVNAVRTQQPVRVAAPQGGMQTVMRTSTPTAGSQAAAAANGS